VLPDFLIIGAQKAGTSSLHAALAKHPCAVSATAKELAFFDIKFNKGLRWYQGHFPTRFRKLWYEYARKRKFSAFEGTVSYMFHPHALRRISRCLPRVKLIVMLRNPVDRAYSDYWWRKRWHSRHVKTREDLFPSFEDAIAMEEDGKIAREELAKMLGDETHPYHKYYEFSYLTRGVYVDQLKNVMNFVPRDRVMVIKSEAFFDNPSRVFQSVLEFLELPSWQPNEFEIRKQGDYPKMDPSTRKRLTEYFEPYNQRLYDYFGVDFDWH
jgi:hypothetical protein